MIRWIFLLTISFFVSEGCDISVIAAVEEKRSYFVGHDPCCATGHYNIQWEDGAFWSKKVWCDECPAGWYQDQLTKADACQECPAGQYQDETAQTGCEKCSPGYGANEGASSSNGCGPCTPGRFSITGGGCQDCSAGKYMPNSFGNYCALCPNGRYLTTEGNVAESDCIDCPAGKVNPGGSYGTDYDSSEDCDQCLAGQYQFEAGKESCEPCGAGSFRNSAGGSMCEPCGRGKYSIEIGAALEASCKNCPAGWYQPSLGRDKCIPCEKGRFNNVEGDWGFLNWYQSDRYNYRCGDSNSFCKPGTYQDETAQTECKKCPTGKWSADTAATTNTCKSCPIGKYQSVESASSASMCISCPAGRYSITSEAGSETDCLFCPVGWYQSQSAKTDCIQCDARKVTGMLTGAPNCDFTCSNGYLSGARSNCEKCPEGEYFNYADGDTTCKKCSTQLPRSDGTSCYRCLPGYHRQSCTICPAGRYTGWETEVLTECRLCEAGYQDELGQGNCKTCPAGRISSADRKTCVTCPLGEYSDAENLIECKTCSITGQQHTGMIGQKTALCATGNIKGINTIYTDGLGVDNIELSGSNDGSARNLQRCVGECDAIGGDNNAQCAPGLICFQRSHNEPIPGCKGNGGGRDWDYCYDPNLAGVSGTKYGYQASLNDVINNVHVAYRTTCQESYYQNTFDGSCKECPVGLFKGADPLNLKIVGPNDFNTCKFCPVGQNAQLDNVLKKRLCVDCAFTEAHYNQQILKDFAHEDCRYDDCSPGLFAQNGECSECPAGTYWESKPDIGTPYENSILHSCDQMETQFHADLTAAHRTKMKTDCEQCYANPSTTVIYMGTSACVGTNHFSGGFQSPSLKIYDDLDAPTNPGNTLEEERDACETACRNFVTTDTHIINRDGDNLEITGFIIWVQESRRGMCYCAVNTDLTTCKVSSTKHDTVRTYRFASTACQTGKDLRAATSSYTGLCRSCPVGQYQDSTGQVTCKSCSTATTRAATSC